MTEYRESFGEDVGSKLLLLASMLVVFGVPTIILLPLATAFAPAAPAPEAPAAATGAAAEAAAPFNPFMPGLMMLIAAVIFGILAGLLLAHAKARQSEPPSPTH